MSDKKATHKIVRNFAFGKPDVVQYKAGTEVALSGECATFAMEAGCAKTIRPEAPEPKAPNA